MSIRLAATCLCLTCQDGLVLNKWIRARSILSIHNQGVLWCRMACIFSVILMMSFTSGCINTLTTEETEYKQYTTQAWLEYDGAWFKIEYPSHFNVQPSLIENSEQTLYDSVFFIAPDKKVSFYVLSPQWRREATDIALRPKLEVLASKSQKNEGDFIQTTRVIQPRDGSYERQVESFVSKDQTSSWAFQFLYSDQETKSNYQGMYERFKASLQQYGD